MTVFISDKRSNNTNSTKTYTKPAPLAVPSSAGYIHSTHSMMCDLIHDIYIIYSNGGLSKEA